MLAVTVDISFLFWGNVGEGQSGERLFPGYTD